MVASISPGDRCDERIRDTEPAARSMALEPRRAGGPRRLWIRGDEIEWVQQPRNDVSVVLGPAGQRLANYDIAGEELTPFGEPWPLDAWPDVPTRVLLSRKPSGCA